MNRTAELSPNGITVAHRSRRAVYGFTLIELLVVMAIILILASITFGITRGVQGAQARAKAQGELAVLAQALESFKLRYGDYPHINMNPVANAQGRPNNTSSHQLLRALTGWRDIKTNLPTDTKPRQEELIDITRFSIAGIWNNPNAAPADTVFFNDPWGNAYVYLYKNPSSPEAWQRFGYLLFSVGPNGRFNGAGFDATTGIYTRAFREHEHNRDIIFAGE